MPRADYLDRNWRNNEKGEPIPFASESQGRVRVRLTHRLEDRAVSWPPRHDRRRREEAPPRRRCTIEPNSSPCVKYRAVRVSASRPESYDAKRDRPLCRKALFGRVRFVQPPVGLQELRTARLNLINRCLSGWPMKDGTIVLRFARFDVGTRPRVHGHRSAYRFPRFAARDAAPAPSVTIW